MNTLDIIRLETNDNGTYGIIRYGSFKEFGQRAIIGFTFELPERNNEVGTSSIPAGAYQAEKYESPKNGNVIILKDVPGRTNIQIHIGNTLKDTTGCILVGDRIGMLNGEYAVLRSRKTMKNLLQMVPNKFIINIFDEFVIR